MRRARVISAGVLLLLAAVAALAADLNGKWKASIPGRDGQTREVTFSFTVAGDQLTGTVTGMRGNESQISDGKVTGDAISFSQVVEFGGNQMKFLYKGKVSGDEIKFTRQREGATARRNS